MKLLWTMGCGQSTKSPTKEDNKVVENSFDNEITTVKSIVKKKSLPSSPESSESLDHAGGVKLGLGPDGIPRIPSSGSRHGSTGLVSMPNARPGHAVKENGEAVNIDGLPPPNTPPPATESLISKIPVRKDSATVPLPTMPVKTESQIEFFRMLDEKIEQGPDLLST